MRVLHATFFHDRPVVGIAHQMAWEQSAAHENGFQWRARIGCAQADGPGEVFVRLFDPSWNAPRGWWDKGVSWCRFRLAYYRWLHRQARDHEVILLRHSVYDPFQCVFLAWHGKKTYLVHHTLETHELALGRGRLKSRVLVVAEAVLGGLSLRLARGVVAVTPEILAYERARAWGGRRKPGWVYPNGILCRPEEARPEPDVRAEKPTLLFVASTFVPWHGLDVLLDSVLSSADDFVLHLVGHVPQDQAARVAHDPRVVRHGRLGQDEILRLARQCWLGLGSFALYRNRMREACTLKVREYLENGLPVYSGHQDVFPEDFPYYRVGAPDMSAILAHAHRARAWSRQAVSERARPFISKTRLVRQLHDDLRTSTTGARADSAGGFS